MPGFVRSGYPVFTSPDLPACRDFYALAFDARVLFESPWYLQLAIDELQIGFVHPSPPMRLPVFRHTTPSRASSLVLEVADIDAAYTELLARGVEALGKPETYPDGEIAFQVVDPAGVVLNLIQAPEGDGLDLEF